MDVKRKKLSQKWHASMKNYFDSLGETACKNCGRTFQKKSSNQKFCGLPCKNYWHYENRKDHIPAAEFEKFGIVIPTLDSIFEEKQ